MNANKIEWLRRVETYSEEVQEMVVSYLVNEFITDVERTQADNLLEVFTTQVTDYMIAYHNKIACDEPSVQQAANRGHVEVSGDSDSLSLHTVSLTQATTTVMIMMTSSLFLPTSLSKIQGFRYKSSRRTVRRCLKIKTLLKLFLMRKS